MIYAYLKPEKLINLSYCKDIHPYDLIGNGNWRRQIINILNGATYDELIEIRLKTIAKLTAPRDDDERKFWGYVNLAVQNKMMRFKD